MPEAFKNNFNKRLIQKMALELTSTSRKFDSEGFVKKACSGLDDLELKDRSAQITKSLINFLPNNFETAGKIILKSLAEPNEEISPLDNKIRKGIHGWGIMPLTHYVGLRGHDDFELSMKLLKEMTKLFSSEFDIRFFLIKSPKKTLKVLHKWAIDKNHHVRRLASEGSRPRLPWAMKLQDLIDDPEPIIKLLEKLKDDKSEYVRRSVANNLNDISKDHPDLIAKIAKAWLKDASHNRKRLVRHACRSLIKSGHRKTLTAFGYKMPQLKATRLQILTPKVNFGDYLKFKIKIESGSDRKQDLIIDYIIHHKKANGSTSPKVFKWKVLNLGKLATIEAIKKHPMKKISTRVYYPGIHYLEIVVNGSSVGKTKFTLKM